MRKIIITGLFAAVLAACATAAAPAMAHEFVASQTKGAIQDKNIGNHVFESGLITIECTEETSKGVVQVKHSAVSNEEVAYKGCKALSLPAEVSQAKYIFKAEGTVTVNGEITVKIPKEGCEVKVPGASNENLGTVTYTNNQQSGTIELNAAVTGITSTLSGTGAICPKGSTKTGKYKGASLVQFYECLPTQGGQYQEAYCFFKGSLKLYEEFPATIYFV